MSIDLDGGKAFEMSTVIGRYNDYLNEQQMVPVPNKAHPLIRPGAPGLKTN